MSDLSSILSTQASDSNGSSSEPPSSHGEGVDRKIEKNPFAPKRIAWIAGALALVALVGYGVWTSATGGQSLNVDREKITVSTVEQGPFQEFIAVTGSVLPERTVYLDAVEGGRVEEVYIREGTMVGEGDPILRLSNNDLRLQMLNSEASLAEQQSSMQQLRLSMEQRSLNLQQQIAQTEYDVQVLRREHSRQEQLYEKDLIAEQEYLDTRDQLAYQERSLELTRAAYVQDSLSQQSRLAQMENTTQRLEQSYSAMQAAISNLTVEAPISGQLTALDAEVGQIIASGTRLGQVDNTDSYKIRAQVDEFYIERVRAGQPATTQPIGGTEHTLTVARVYPEVQNGSFEVDLRFEGEQPESIRRGQSIRLRLELGSPEAAMLLSRGGFYQSTGGNWAYVLTENGDAAVRQPIRLGRQNPDYFEVLGGLEPGDQVVTSGYDTFGEADRLVFQ